MLLNVVHLLFSHINKLSHEEAIAVAKIKEDPNLFFYAMRFSNTKQEIGPFYYENGSLTNEKPLQFIHTLRKIILAMQ